MPQVKLWSGVDLAQVATVDIMATPSISGFRQVSHPMAEQKATVLRLLVQMTPKIRANLHVFETQREFFSVVETKYRQTGRK